MFKSITAGQYFSADATMGNEQYNDGMSTGMKDLVELQPAMLEAVIRGYYGLDLQLMQNSIVVSPNLPTEWMESGETMRISTPEVNYTIAKEEGKLTVELTTAVARRIVFKLPVRSAVLGATIDGASAEFSIETGHVGRARCVVETSSATRRSKVALSLGSDAVVSGDLMTVIGQASKFGVAHATVVAIHDPQHVLARSSITSGQVSLTATVEHWQLDDALTGWPLPATVFLELSAAGQTQEEGAQQVIWLKPLDLQLVPAWRLQTSAVAAQGHALPGFPCPDGPATPCVALPRLGDVAPPPPPPAGRLEMVACTSISALNWSAPLVAQGQKAKIQVLGTNHCLTPAAGSLVLADCGGAPEWYWRSGYESKAGGHLCIASGSLCLDRAHHAADDTTLNTYTFVPTGTEQYHDENWKLEPSGRLISRCVEPSCAANQCVGGALPSPTPPGPPSAASVPVTAVLLNDGPVAVSGTAQISIASLQYNTTVAVSLPPGGSQNVIVHITSTAQLARMSPGTTQIAVTLGGRTQIANAVRWTPPHGEMFARATPLDLSSAWNFDTEDLFSATSMAARWRLDYTGSGIGIEAQIRYNNTARINAQRPGHPIAIDNTPPYKGYYIDSPPITEFGYGSESHYKRQLFFEFSTESAEIMQNCPGK